MKKVKISLEAHMWYGEPIKNPYYMFYCLFDVVHPPELKLHLSELMNHTHKTEIYLQKTPHIVFLIYSLLRSIIRSSYKILSNSKKYYSINPIDKSEVSKLMTFLGALSQEEYLNPYLVFENVFEKQSVVKLETDLFEITQFALGDFIEPPSIEVNTSFISINRLIEACWLLYQRDE